MVFENAMMTVFKYDGSYDQKCTVSLTDDTVRIEYVESGTEYAYQGSSIAPGHFQLRAEGFEGKGSFHRFPGDGKLVGEWLEEGAWGLWSITLGKSN